MNRNPIRETTLKVLEKYPSTRNNDITLMVKVLKKLKMPTDLTELAAVTDSNVLESISRARRYYQAKCPWVAPKGEVSKARKRQEERMREEYGK